MGVKFGYETDRYGHTMEVIVDYFDDGLEVICDMDNLTDYEQAEYEIDTIPPIYKVPVADLLSEYDKKVETDDYIDPYDENMNLWKVTLLS